MRIDELKNKLLQQRGYIDKVYWVLFGILIVVAILALFSASSTLAFEENSSPLGPIMEQMLFIAAGVGLAFVLQFVPSKFIRIASYLGLGISIVFLLLTFTSMGVEINGAKRWLRILGITFQPSELAKLTLILVVSDLLSRIRTAEEQKKYFMIVLALTAVVCGLILVGNLSTALLLGGIVFLLFFLARVHIKEWEGEHNEEVYEKELQSLLTKMHREGAFDSLNIVKPYSFVLTDEDGQSIVDLLIIDDDTLILSADLLEGFDEEMNSFLKKLLEE